MRQSAVLPAPPPGLSPASPPSSAPLAPPAQPGAHAFLPGSRWRAALTLTLALAVLGGAAFAVTLRAAGVSDADRSAHLPRAPGGVVPPTATVPLTTVAERALASVVTVEVDTDRGERFGTGWLLDARGDIVTNNHVISRQRQVRVVDRGGNAHSAAVVGFDSLQDVAVLRAAGQWAGAPLTVAAGAAVVGEAVVVLAAARATDHGEVTAETVAKLHDPIIVNPEPGDPTIGDIQYQDMTVLSGAQIYQGNSGGPVLDGQGQVVGIIAATSASLLEGYAIPVARVIDELRAFAARG